MANFFKDARLGQENQSNVLAKREQDSRNFVLAFLLASGSIPSEMVSANPLLEIKTGRANIDGEKIWESHFKGLAKVTERNVFDMTIRYNAWLETSGGAMAKYSDNQLLSMWTAFCGGGLKEKFALDPVLSMNGMLERTVDGHAYRVVQLSPSIIIGSGWRVADVMVQPTGAVDVSTIRNPPVIRGVSPPIFFNESMSDGERKTLWNLMDNFAATMIGVYDVAKLQTNGSASYHRGVTLGRTLTLKEALYMNNTVSPVVKLDDISYGRTVATVGSSIEEMFLKARKVLVKGVNKVAINAKDMADDFVLDFDKANRGKTDIDVKRLELMAQTFVSTWPGNLLKYFDRNFSAPVLDWYRSYGTKTEIRR